MMEKIIDLTEYYPNAIKAEQKGNDILILRKLEKPFKTQSKAKLSHYELEYQWINPITGGVLGNEFTITCGKPTPLGVGWIAQC